MRAYEYHHMISFEETNLIDNVYYVHHLRWQGRCREQFLRDRAPEVLKQLSQGLVLATTRCSCEYLDELEAFDSVTVRMQLAGTTQNRILLRFEYWLQNGDGEQLVARGEQEIACMQREGQQTIPTAIPAPLREALRPFQQPEQMTQTEESR